MSNSEAVYKPQKKRATVTQYPRLGDYHFESGYHLEQNKPQKKRATVTQAAALLIHNFYLAINKIDL